jgi:hypothetical protein
MPNKPTKIRTIAAACLIPLIAVVASRRWEDGRDYRMFTTPRESELVRASGTVSRVSDHVPYLEIHLDSGQYVLATFVTYPIYRGKALYIRDAGPFDKTKLQGLLNCRHAEFSLLPIHDALTSYWIYGVECDGMTLLSYSETISYVEKERRLTH